MPSFNWGPLLAGSGPFFIGILNLTPDSFSDGGRYADPQAALVQGRCLVAAGAGMLDLGAESTRPGALAVEPAEEWRRLEPVLSLLRKELPNTPLSVDTRRPWTAARALDQGVSVLNDVTGFADPAMLSLAQARRCGVIAMRSRSLNGALWMPSYDGPGNPDAAPSIQELQHVHRRLANAGIEPARVLLDPGFGFGTTFAEDRALWAALPALPAQLDWPMERFCIGISRKRFVARQFAGDPSLPAQDRDPATAAAHRDAIGWGYRVFRSHAL
jgi:dihydropteroate synthase